MNTASFLPTGRCRDSTLFGVKRFVHLPVQSKGVHDRDGSAINPDETFLAKLSKGRADCLSSTPNEIRHLVVSQLRIDADARSLGRPVGPAEVQQKIGQSGMNIASYQILDTTL